jgi:hypothetical protein
MLHADNTAARHECDDYKSRFQAKLGTLTKAKTQPLKAR